MFNDRLRSGCSRHPMAITCHRTRFRHRRRVHPSRIRSRPPPHPPRGRIVDPASLSSRTRGPFPRRRGVHRRRWPLAGSRPFGDVALKDHCRDQSPGRSLRNLRMVVEEEKTNDEVMYCYLEALCGVSETLLYVNRIKDRTGVNTRVQILFLIPFKYSSLLCLIHWNTYIEY